MTMKNNLFTAFSLATSHITLTELSSAIRRTSSNSPFVCSCAAGAGVPPPAHRRQG